MTTYLSEEEALQRLERTIRAHGTVTAFAQDRGLDRAGISAMRTGKRPRTIPVANALGLRRVVAYVVRDV